MAALSEADRAAVGYTLAMMNSIAIACEAKYVDVSVVQQSMGRSFAAAIAAARPYIDELERRRGFRPYGYAERLATRMSPERSPSPPSRSAAPPPADRDQDEDAEPDHAASA
jgi:hypothetical protein